MDELLITCCNLCGKFFDYESVEVAVYNKGDISNYCLECGEKLIKHIEKLKNDVEEVKE